MELFKLPRKLGQAENGDEVSVGIGRFGPFVKQGSTYASLKPEDDPYTIELPRALQMMAEKLEMLANRLILDFGNGVQVLNGRYGPYITDGEKNARIPKEQEPKELTEAQCLELLAAAPVTQGALRQEEAAKKAAAKKAAPAKKAAGKKDADEEGRSKKTAGQEDRCQESGHQEGAQPKKGCDRAKPRPESTASTSPSPISMLLPRCCATAACWPIRPRPSSAWAATRMTGSRSSACSRSSSARPNTACC